MEYAIDKDGNRIHYSVAKSNNNLYRCPHCLERVYVRGGLRPCFYHKPIPDRTPLQRTCPEYHENDSYKKIEDELDVLYIKNGGIPLYLCNNGERFQLRAYFPKLSDNIYNKLKQIGVKIHVNAESVSEIDRKTYTIENLDFYPVNTMEKWIYVTCEPSVSDKEIQRKWLWGIRGVDIENDIYYCNRDGGYRVALKANISIGKMYRIMFDRHPPRIDGINFRRVGEIHLKEGVIYRKIDIYEMLIYKFTEEANKFIGGKGYKLIEKTDELLPLWPPGIFRGNEITFDKHTAFFLYINNSKRGRLYYTLYNHLFKINHNKSSNSIVPLEINDDKAIIISDEEISNYEIKYSIQYSPTLIQKQELKPEIVIKDLSGKIIDFDEEDLKPPIDGKLYISSNIPFCAIVNNKNYVISSSNTYFENVSYLWDLIIDSKAFGINKYSYKRKEQQNKIRHNIDWKFLYLKLYRCTSPMPTVNAGNRYFKLLYLLSQNINKNNIQLYRLLDKWIKTNSIPISATKYLDEIFKYLGGIANE